MATQQVGLYINANDQVVASDGSYTIDSTHQTVLVKAANVTLKMPPNPQQGEKHIIVANAGNVALLGNGFPITDNVVLKDDLALIVFTGTKWVVGEAGSAVNNQFVYNADSDPIINAIPAPLGNGEFATFRDAYNAAFATGLPATIVCKMKIFGPASGYGEMRAGVYDFSQIDIEGLVVDGGPSPEGQAALYLKEGVSIPPGVWDGFSPINTSKNGYGEIRNIVMSSYATTPITVIDDTTAPSGYRMIVKLDRATIALANPFNRWFAINETDGATRTLLFNIGELASFGFPSGPGNPIVLYGPGAGMPTILRFLGPGSSGNVDSVKSDPLGASGNVTVGIFDASAFVTGSFVNGVNVGSIGYGFATQALRVGYTDTAPLLSSTPSGVSGTSKNGTQGAIDGLKFASTLNSGISAARPTTGPALGAQPLVVGQVYFDTEDGIPIWWNGVSWINAAGVAV